MKLSATKVNKFLRCQRSYEDHYIRNNKSEPTQALTQGSISHQVVAYGFEHKVEHKTDIDLQKKLDLVEELFEEDQRTGNTSYNDPVSDVIKQTREIVTVHDEEISQRVTPVLIEKPFNVDVNGVDLVGVWDLIDEDGTIIDFKTYSKRPSEAEVDRDLQLSFYSLAYRLLFGEIEQGIRLDIVLKQKNMKSLQILTSRTSDELRWTARMIEQIAEQMEGTVFPPSPNGWHCDPRYCGAWDNCQYGNY